MEQDRYKENHTLYIVGIVCLVLSMALFGFGLYLMPYLLWGWIYKVPGIVLNWQQWLQLEYQLGLSGASWSIFLSLLLLAIITAVIAYTISNHIDNQIYHIEPKKKVYSLQNEEEAKETANILYKIILIVLLVALGVVVFQWVIYVPPPAY